jgi:hypothetical protein
VTKQERLQEAWHYFDRRQDRRPSSARQACEWAVAAGILELPDIDPYDALAEDMAQALRGEYRTDSEGRRYRVNHAVRVTKSGVQYTFWAEMGFAPPDHMERAFAQRREQIVGDCLQLKIDVDAYNSMTSDKTPKVQMVLNFTDDVAEREEARRFGRAA